VRNNIKSKHTFVLQNSDTELVIQVPSNDYGYLIYETDIQEKEDFLANFDLSTEVPPGTRIIINVTPLDRK
jgi:hypothetical protein